MCLIKKLRQLFYSSPSYLNNTKSRTLILKWEIKPNNLLIGIYSQNAQGYNFLVSQTILRLLWIYQGRDK